MYRVREGSSAQPPIGSDKARPLPSVSPALTRTGAGEEALWSGNSCPSTTMEPHRTFRRFLRDSEPFTDGARPKGEMSPSEVTDACSDPHLTTRNNSSDRSALRSPSGLHTRPISLASAMSRHLWRGPYGDISSCCPFSISW